MKTMLFRCLQAARPGLGQTNQLIRSICTSCGLWDSNRASISRPHRFRYPRMYQTMLVNPDGSTINIRYKEPRRIIKLPIDLTQLTEAQRLARLAKRKPKEKIVVVEEIEDTFDLNKYSHLWKKK